MRYNGKDHGPSVKDDEPYEALRREGASKEKAAGIANEGSRSATGRKGGESSSYEDRSKEELLERAKEPALKGGRDVEGRDGQLVTILFV